MLDLSSGSIICIQCTTPEKRCNSYEHLVNGIHSRLYPRHCYRTRLLRGGVVKIKDVNELQTFGMLYNLFYITQY